MEQQAWALYHKFFESEVIHQFQNTYLKNVTNNIKNRVGNNNFPVFAAVNTGKLELSETYFSKQVYSKNIKNYLIVKKNSFAYNPARINIGSIGLNEHGFTGCVSPVYVVFDCEYNYHHFFKFFIKSKKFKENVKVRSSGSVRQSLTYKDFGEIDILYPPKDVIYKFNSRYEPILYLQKQIIFENINLNKIRDSLLPKLMSGELDVSVIDI